jgi:hypothetical protein
VPARNRFSCVLALETPPPLRRATDAYARNVSEPTSRRNAAKAGGTPAQSTTTVPPPLTRKTHQATSARPHAPGPLLLGLREAEVLASARPTPSARRSSGPRPSLWRWSSRPHHPPSRGLAQRRHCVPLGITAAACWTAAAKREESSPFHRERASRRSSPTCLLRTTCERLGKFRMGVLGRPLAWSKAAVRGRRPGCEYRVGARALGASVLQS